MGTQVLEGGFQDAPIEAARAFRAAMTAMARPGTIVTLDSAAPPAPLGAAAGTLVLTLCDPDTPIYLAGELACRAVKDWITFHTGAPFCPPADAMFALGAWEDLMPLARFPVGVSEYPDRSTTLIAEMSGLTASGHRLTGPGIQTDAFLSLPETEVFQANAALFPLGLDFYFTCGTQAAALPRSIKVEC